MTVVLTGNDLTLGEVVRVARHSEHVELAPQAIERMQEARRIVAAAAGGEEPVYGLTVGVGVRKRYRVPPSEMRAFNRAMILNHRVGQGPPAPEEVVRATLLRLANAFAKGTAGVRPELASRLVAALNAGETLHIRSLGSTGQSDLPQLADVAHGLFGEAALEAKEGIGLLNSSAYSTALAALAAADAARYADTLDVVAALELEAFAANLSILSPAVGEVRPYAGLRASVDRLRRLLDGSYLWERGAARNLQDPLTFRNVVQVHGALRDALDFALSQLAVELNASQENPLVVLAEGRIVSVGNYDVLPLAAALDFLRIALAPAVTSGCERCVKLLQAPLSGLPAGLATYEHALEDSLAEFSWVAQALAAEARLLAEPVSYEVVSTTQAEGIEDRMTMAPLAARRLGDMVALAERLLAIELVIAAQAVDLRSRRPLGVGTAEAYRLVRERIPFSGEGEPIPQDLEPVVALIRSGALGLPR
jgi:histidine ammonia-lyase